MGLPSVSVDIDDLRPCLRNRCSTISCRVRTTLAVITLIADQLFSKSGAVQRRGFNAVQFFPDQPDEVGLWPEGVVPAIAGGG